MRFSLSPWAAAFFCILLYCGSESYCLPYCLSIALHEAGHAVACLLLHIPIQGLTVGLLGAELSARFPGYRSELAVCLAGPAANLLLSIAVLHTWPLLGLLNLALALYNLLPIYPLDGGHILKCILLSHCCMETADRSCRIAEAVSTGLLILLGVYLSCFAHAGLFGCLFASALLLKTAVLRHTAQE